MGDYGGKAEVNQYCGAANYGAPLCMYPWFTLNEAGYYTYGGNYPGTLKDLGQADQFQQTEQCPGPSGPNTNFCATILK